ncbi:MAG: hypothetical protein IJR04_10230 [Bacteroidales bacterium]|nr:hypothetical protein [Bacteroidales bacterium]
MKKILILCVAIFTLLVSCSKDYENMIVGTWEYEQITTKKTKDGVTTETTRTSDNDGELGKMIFRDDKTCSVYSYSNLGFYYVEDSYIYSFDDDYLILTDSRDNRISVKYRIESMKSSELVLCYKQNAVTTYETPEPLDYDIIEVVYIMRKQNI